MEKHFCVLFELPFKTGFTVDANRQTLFGLT